MFNRLINKLASDEPLMLLDLLVRLSEVLEHYANAGATMTYVFRMLINFE